MLLEELLYLINDSSTVELYDSATYDVIGTYDGKESIDEIYNECEVTDIFDTVKHGLTPYSVICIEINTQDTL